jgi:hypothetical protein
MRPERLIRLESALDLWVANEPCGKPASSIQLVTLVSVLDD